MQGRSWLVIPPGRDDDDDDNAGEDDVPSPATPSDLGAAEAIMEVLVINLKFVSIGQQSLVLFVAWDMHQ